MNKYIMIALVASLIGCSKHNVNMKGIPNKIEIENKPIKLEVRIQIQEASYECNKRFGYNTDESNACFLAYLQFLKIDISLDVQSIQDYCNERYTKPKDKTECENQLMDILEQLGRQ